MSDTDIKDSGMFRMMALVIGALTVLTLVIIFTARGLGESENDDNPMVREALLDRIGPVARVRTADDAPAAEAPLETEPTAVAALSGDEIVQAHCSACHAAGVAGAPLIDDEAAWAERRQAGLDALVASVINGKGAMPARAGTQLSDDELRSATIVLAGFEEEASADMAEPAGDEAAIEADAATVDDAASNDAAAADADEGTAAEQPAADAEAPAADETTGESPGEAGASGEAASEEGVAAGEESTSEAPAPVDSTDTADQSAEAAVAGDEATEMASTELTDDVKTAVDEGVCAGCHIAGVANAPKTGDKAAWDARLAELGMDGLVASVINGKGAMPARGASTLSDEELAAAVQYLISK